MTKKPFHLPSFRLRKKAAQAGRMSLVTVQAGSSTDRVLNNTKTLRDLYDFLAASKARVP